MQFSRTPKQRAKARQKFAKLKRFGEVIIRSAIESANAVLDSVSRSEHKDGHPPPGFPKPAANFESVRSGNHDVQNDQVVLVDVRLIKRIFTGSGGIDRVSLLAQSFDHKPAHPLIVFDEQYPHGCMIRETARKSAVFAFVWKVNGSRKSLT